MQNDCVDRLDSHTIKRVKCVLHIGYLFQLVRSCECVAFRDK